MRDDSHFLSEFDRIIELYFKAKELIITVEQMEDERKIYVALINELRNAFDHVVRAATKFPPECSVEFTEARSHLSRAAYDAIEIRATNSILKISDDISVYDRSDVSTVIPKYFSEYRPMAEEAKQRLAKHRTNKQNDPLDLDVSVLNEYLGEVVKLEQIHRNCLAAIPDLERMKAERTKRAEQESSQRRNDIMGRRWQRGLQVGGAIGAALLVFCLGRWSISNPPSVIPAVKASEAGPVTPDTEDSLHRSDSLGSARLP